MGPNRPDDIAMFKSSKENARSMPLVNANSVESESYSMTRIRLSNMRNNRTKLVNRKILQTMTAMKP